MFFQNKNSLPKVIFDRDALTQKLPKIKPRVLRRFIQLAIVVFIILALIGYYPTRSIPPIKRSIAQATEETQNGEIIAKSFSKPLSLPHPGYLTTKFSSWHPGIDIASGLGMPIHPITDGEVSEVGRDLFGLGNYVVITHEQGFKSKYAHMGKVFVKASQKVTSENTLGEVGLTGNTSGPHTHLEVTQNDKFINPQTLLPEISPIPLEIARK
ncbi:M23 family metallopeptidase [Candidatus Daviesbacteria bacterium]|nr:M23 family metallopeptidase [Candidatus Daviesbacteria bacterium]